MSMLFPQNQSTLPRGRGHHQSLATASGHHTIAICKNAAKAHGVPPPQPPMRTSSNTTAGGGILVTGGPSSSALCVQMEKGEHQHHQHQPASGSGGTVSGNNGSGCSSAGTQVHLVSALQSNYNSGTNPTSTLKKRVQIQEVTV